MNTTNLRMLQLAELDLLIELDRICKKYSIKYFLSGGTLLGAVRHKGFIPWDDDIDVIMMREDYELFLKVCNAEINKEYKLYNWDNDNSPLPFSKLKINGTELLEESSLNSNVSKGVYIDIFPFDKVSNNKVKRWFQKIKILSMKKILLVRCNCKVLIHKNKFEKLIGKILYFILKIIYLPFSTNKIKRMFSKEMIKYNHLTNCKYCIEWGGAYSYKKELKKISYFKEIIYTEFEGVKFPISKQYDLILNEMYGDYMKLPPISERRQHNIRFDLGNYKIKSLDK